MLLIELNEVLKELYDRRLGDLACSDAIIQLVAPSKLPSKSQAAQTFSNALEAWWSACSNNLLY